MASVARRASMYRNRTKCRAQDARARKNGTATSTVSDNYGLDSAVRLATQCYEHLRLGPQLEELVPDIARNKKKPRIVTVRVLIIMMIAQALQAKDLHLTKVAANLCSHTETHGRRFRLMQKKTRRIVGLPDVASVSRDNVQDTHDQLKEALALRFKIDIGDGNNLEDTLLNLLGVDLPQAAISGSGEAAFYSQSSGRATDSSFVDACAARPTKIDDETGEILYQCYDRDARILYRTPTKRDERDKGLGYYLEALVATRNLPANQTKHRVDDEPYPGTCTAARFHNGQHHSATETVTLIDLETAFGATIDTVIADRAFTNALPHKWAIPLRQRGMELVHDLREDQRGRFPLATIHRNGRTISLEVVDGLIFETHIADWLATQNLIDIPRLPWRSGTSTKTARSELLAKHEYRAKFAWREHDRRTPTSFRLRGPAHQVNPTAWCNNTSDLDILNNPRQYSDQATPCALGDQCNCRALVTINLNLEDRDQHKFAKIRQHRSWGTSGWDNHYGDRNLAESLFSGFKGNITSHDDPLAIRTNGLEARGLATLCIIAATNIALTAGHRIKRGEEARPRVEPTQQPIQVTWVAPEPDTSPDPPGTDSPDTGTATK